MSLKKMLCYITTFMLALVLSGCYTAASTPKCPECGEPTTEYCMEHYAQCASCYKKDHPRTEDSSVKSAESTADSSTKDTKSTGDSSSQDAKSEDKEQSQKEAEYKVCFGCAGTYRIEDYRGTNYCSNCRAKGKSGTSQCPKCGKKADDKKILAHGMCDSCYEKYGLSDRTYDTGSQSKDSSSSYDAECPICGKGTTEKQLKWQGMCSSCYSTYEKLKDSRSSSYDAECPICGKGTTEKQLKWQGMCSSCYSTYQYLKDYQ